MVALGIHRNAAKVFLYMAANGNTTSDELERVLELGQPSVSTAIKDLNGMGWLNTEYIMSDRKGRPRHKYSLSDCPSKIIEEIERKVNVAIKSLNSGLAILKAL